MSHTRVIPGIGYNTIEGSPKADGAIKEIETSSDKKSELNILPSRRVQELKKPQNYDVMKTPPTSNHALSQIDYTMSLIKNYQELTNALELHAGLTGAFSKASASIEVKFFQKVSLTEETLALFIKIKTITHTEHISKNGKLIMSAREVLKENLSNFVEAYGDSYITEVDRGKVLYAAIIYKNITISELDEIKSVFEANLNTLGIGTNSKKDGVSAKVKIEKKLNEMKRSSLIDIKIECAGVNIDIPAIGTDIHQLLGFIEKYNNKDNLQPNVIIGFKWKPYIVACTPYHHTSLLEKKDFSRGKEEKSETNIVMEIARSLQEKTTLTLSLLKQCDDYYKQLSYIIPTMEKTTQHIKNCFFEKESDKLIAQTLNQLSYNANELSETIKILAEKIYANRMDIKNLYKIIINNKRARSPEFKMEIDIDAIEETTIFDQLKLLLYKIFDEIKLIERKMNKLLSGLAVEIIDVSPKLEHFHVSNLPKEGINILWQVHLTSEDKKDELRKIKFNLLTKKINDSNCITTFFSAKKSWHIEDQHYNIGHLSTTFLQLASHDLLKVQFLNREHVSREDIHIKGYVIGPSVTKIEDAKYRVTWPAANFDLSIIKPLEPELKSSAFCAQIDLPYSYISLDDSSTALFRTMEKKSQTHSILIPSSSTHYLNTTSSSTSFSAPNTSSSSTSFTGASSSSSSTIFRSTSFLRSSNSSTFFNGVSSSSSSMINPSPSFFSPASTSMSSSSSNSLNASSFLNTNPSRTILDKLFDDDDDEADEHFLRNNSLTATPDFPLISKSSLFASSSNSSTLDRHTPSEIISNSSLSSSSSSSLFDSSAAVNKSSLSLLAIAQKNTVKSKDDEPEPVPLRALNRPIKTGVK